jgi:hypothetical protein
MLGEAALSWYSEKSSDTLFQLSVTYKSYPQLLLKLAMLDKLRLATFHKW